MAEGYTGGGAGGDTAQYAGSSVRASEGSVGRGNQAAPITEKVKRIKKGTSNRIYAISLTASDTSSLEDLPKKVEVSNVGSCPVTILSGYETYSNETTGSGATRYLQTQLMPNQSFSPPVRSVISTEAATTQFDGTESNSGVFTAPATTTNFAYVDSGVNLGDKIEGSDTTITTEAAGTNAFRVGDLIQIGTTSGTAATNLEIMRVKSISSTTVMVVERNLFGSVVTVDGDAQTNATNGAVSGANINFPYFNAYYDFDKYTSVRTDGDGKFKCQNFFGLGRSKTATDNVGLVGGSVAIKFYEAGYQSLGLSGITPNTETGLTAGATYYLTVAVDGGSTVEINVTLDSANTKFGGSNGLIQKLQDAIDAKYTVAGGLFEKEIFVRLIDGDLRFTSGQRISTSAIALTAGTSGADASVRFLAQANGRIPALASINTAIAARIPDDNSYDPVTYEETPNESGLIYDDGYGRLQGAGRGTVNYETGEISIYSAPKNADLVYVVNHSSAFSGKLNENVTGRKNTLVEILANTISPKSGKVKVVAR